MGATLDGRRRDEREPEPRSAFRNSLPALDVLEDTVVAANIARLLFGIYIEVKKRVIVLNSVMLHAVLIRAVGLNAEENFAPSDAGLAHGSLG